MVTVTLIMFLIGIIGFLVTLVWLLVNVIRKRNLKKVSKILGGSVVLIALSLLFKPGMFSPRAVETTTAVMEPGVTEETVPATETETETAVAEEPVVKTFTDGTYLVDKDIPSGLYRVTLNDTALKMGYVERAKDVTMGTDSIIANILLTGNGYVEILKTDVAVKLQGVTIEPINIKELKPAIETEATDGIYLVGYDLAIGTYKVEVTDTTTKMGYVERSKSVSMGMNDTIANQLVQGPSYVKIVQGDFAVRLQGVKITLQK